MDNPLLIVQRDGRMEVMTCGEKSMCTGNRENRESTTCTTSTMICKRDSRRLCIGEVISSEPHKRLLDAERVECLLETEKKDSGWGQRSKRSSAFSIQSSIVIRSSIFTRSMNRINLQKGFENVQHRKVLSFGKVTFPSKIANFMIPSTGLSNGHVPKAIA